MASKSRSLVPVRGTDSESALMAMVPEEIRRKVQSMLPRPTDKMDVDLVSNGRPSTSHKGFMITGTLVGSYVIACGTDKKESMLHATIVIDDVVEKAFQPHDAAKNEPSCIFYVNSDMALARVDAQYKLTDEDKNKLKADGIKLHQRTTSGHVSVGLRVLYKGMLLRVSRYGVKEITFKGAVATPGARVQFTNATFTVNWDRATGLGSDVSCLAGGHQVLRTGPSNAMTLYSSLMLATAVPSLTFTPPEMGPNADPIKWPRDMPMVLEFPADSKPDSRAPASRPQIEASPSSGAPATAPKLTFPAHPIMFRQAEAPFIAHLGESVEEQTARALITPPGCNLTTFLPPILSTDKDAVSRTLEDKSVAGQARFAILCKQCANVGCPDVDLSAIIHCQITIKEPIQLFTGTTVFDRHMRAIKSLVAGFRGPVLIEPHLAPEFEYEGLPGYEHAVTATSYISTIPTCVLALTASNAGLRVSPEMMRVYRAVDGTAEDAASAPKWASSCHYHAVDGPAGPNSSALMLNVTPPGFFDDKSMRMISTILAQNSGSPSKQRQAITGVLSDLTGPIVDLAETHDFYVVGLFVPTQEVIEHQRRLNATDPTALMEGNAQLINSRTVPAGFPDFYEGVLQEADQKDLIHYAVNKNFSSSSGSEQRIKRQIEAIGSNKRAAIENAPGAHSPGAAAKQEDID